MFGRKGPQEMLQGQLDKKVIKEIIQLAHLFDGVWNYVWLIGDLTKVSTLELLEEYLDDLRQPQVRKALIELREWMTAAEELNLEIYDWARQICQAAGQRYVDQLEDGLMKTLSKREVEGYRDRYLKADTRGKKAILSELLRKGEEMKRKTLPLLKKYGGIK